MLRIMEQVVMPLGCTHLKVFFTLVQNVCIGTLFEELWNRCVASSHAEGSMFSGGVDLGGRCQTMTQHASLEVWTQLLLLCQHLTCEVRCQLGRQHCAWNALTW